MNPIAPFEKIDLQRIEHSDTWNLHPFLPQEPPQALCSSIAALGILHPPILIKRPEYKNQLLCGRYRIRAFECSSPSEKSITALVLNSSTSPQQILQYVLADQLLTGSLSSMEKACFFHFGLEHIGIDSTKEIFLSFIGGTIQNHRIEKTVLLLDLEPELQQGVHDGSIHEKLAFELLRLGSLDRLTLHSLFKELELGGGKQKRLMTLSRDLAFRQGKTITSLLQEGDYMTIRNHPEMNRPQKAATLLSALQAQLFPQSSAAEEQFKRHVNRMQLPSSCTVSHSQAFEQNEAAITMRFTSLTEMEKRLPEIKQLTQR